MDLLRNGKERSIAEIASLIGATGPAMHYQVAQLLNAGLVVRVGKRRAGPRSETIYRAVSTKIRVPATPAKPESPEYMEALLALAMIAIRRLERELTKAYTSISAAGESPAVRVIERKGHVRAEDLPQLYALLRTAADLIGPGAQHPDEATLSLHVFTVGASPIIEP
jgi:DNA-binding Lrp family transcriptional regulator